jgi:hypothetical protein
VRPLFEYRLGKWSQLEPSEIAESQRQFIPWFLRDGERVETEALSNLQTARGLREAVLGFRSRSPSQIEQLFFCNSERPFFSLSCS